MSNHVSDLSSPAVLLRWALGLVLLVFLASCRPEPTVLSLPETDLRLVASPEQFDPVEYLESIRFVRGSRLLGNDGKGALASIVFDAFYYAAETNRGGQLPAESDLVMLVQLNYAPTNQALPMADGRVSLRALVERVRPHVSSGLGNRNEGIEYPTRRRSGVRAP